MSSKTLFLLYTVAILALLSACSAEDTVENGADSSLTDIKVGMFPYGSYAPLYIAEVEGYYAEQELEVTFVPFTSTSDALVALILGDIDVTAGPITIGFMQAVAQGSDIRFVADKGYADFDGCIFSGWMARNEIFESGELDDLGNLPNLNVAYRATDPTHGFAMDTFLEPVGLISENLNISNVHAPNVEEAFRNGSIDVAAVGEPWITRIQNSGVAQLLSWNPYEDDAQFATVWFGPTLVTENRDAGIRFATAYLKAVRLYNEGKTEKNVKLMAEFTELDEELVRESCWQAFNNDGSIEFQSIQDIQKWALDKGIIERIVPSEDYWDGEFIEYANEALE